MIVSFIISNMQRLWAQTLKYGQVIDVFSLLKQINMPKIIKKYLKTLKTAYSLLKQSWKVQTRIFFEDSTLHGVRFIAENGRPFIEKFMWFACVAIGAVTTVVIIVSLWEKFQTNPTITGLDTDFHNWDVSFPGLTICQESPSNLSRIEQYVEENAQLLSPKISSEQFVKFLLGLTLLNFKTIKEFTSSSAYNVDLLAKKNVDLKNLTFSLMNHCDEIFADCEFLSIPIDCCTIFFPVFTETGFCYAFNSRHYEKYVPWLNSPLPDFQMRFISETDLKWAFKFSVKDRNNQMAIYILHSNEEVGTDIQPHHIWEFTVKSILFSVKDTYTTEDTRQLSRKQRHCTFPNEVILEIDHIYTYTACTKQCRMDNSMKLCQCVPFFYDNTNNSYYKHCHIDQLKCIADNLNEIENTDRCNCQLGCFNTVYEVEKLTDLSPDVSSLEIQFVSWPMIRYKREVLFGWVDLLVSFGGIAGLFLGFSLLSGVEIVYYFTLRAVCMVIRERNQLERLANEARKKPLIDYDLSLVPYCIQKPYPGNGLNQVIRSYYRGQFKNNGGKRKVAPMKQGSRWKTSDTLLPPFGIEFIN